VTLGSRPVLTDYHMHLQPDGEEARRGGAHRWDQYGGYLSPGWIERYVEHARSRAVQEIAFTEHVHRFAEARDWHANAWWREEATEDIDAYCEALGAAKRAGLPVIVGVEMDWLPDRTEEIARFLERRPFDIVLGSVHWVGELAIDHPDYPMWDHHDGVEVWQAYLKELVAAAESGLFDVLAHPDLPKVFGHNLPDEVGAAVMDAVAAIAATGIAVECSSAGLRKKPRELYPEPGLLAEFRAAGVPVTLASDAHRPEDVGSDYPTTVAALRGAGYETITRFAAREPSQVSLRWE